MQTRIELTIDDIDFPKLKISGVRTGTTGDRSVFTLKQQYDLAYGAFENLLHNQLRPAVNEIVDRRKGSRT